MDGRPTTLTPIHTRSAYSEWRSRIIDEYTIIILIIIDRRERCCCIREVTTHARRAATHARILDTHDTPAYIGKCGNYATRTNIT